MSHANSSAEAQVWDKAAQLLLKADELQSQALELFEEGRRLAAEADRFRGRAHALRGEPNTADSGGRSEPSPEIVQATAAPSRGGSACSLTPQQRNVVALIARGCSNKQIARELVVTEGTAANHVRAILHRLDLRSRTQIAVWAVHNGLLPEPADQLVVHVVR